MDSVNTPNMLLILDGFGLYKKYDFNAIENASTPFFDHLYKTYPHAKLQAHGEAVGLPAGVMGNSEVGHLNIGAGRVVKQDLVRINEAVKEGTFGQNEGLKKVINETKTAGGRLHLMGLLSDGGVHSSNEHLYAILQACKENEFSEVYVHCFMDGRDTPPQSGIKYLKQLIEQIEKIGVGKINTLSGRFYAMDRDNRWERVERAYKTLATSYSEDYSSLDPVAEITMQYEKEITDEFIEPVSFSAEGKVQDKDSIIFYNYRSDRAREISRAFFDPEFKEFDRTFLSLTSYTSMVRYKEEFTNPVLFDKQILENVLGEVLAKAGKKQIRIAETEKYAHVTFFLNGAEENPFAEEERILVPSPREVETYDQKPEMSAPEVTENILKELDKGEHDVFIINYANCDMVGHTGIYEAAVKAVETVDSCVEKIVNMVLSKGGKVLLCADHGNSDQMREENGTPHTAHTLNPVPIICISEADKEKTIKDGRLADVMPTFLSMMDMEIPSIVEGEVLIS